MGVKIHFHRYCLDDATPPPDRRFATVTLPTRSAGEKETRLAARAFQGYSLNASAPIVYRLGRGPLKAETGVRFPLGAPAVPEALIDQKNITQINVYTRRFGIPAIPFRIAAARGSPCGGHMVKYRENHQRRGVTACHQENGSDFAE